MFEKFVNTLRNLTKSTPEEIAEFAAAPKRQEQVTARSGQNIQFPQGNIEMSDNYRKAMLDAVKFYQGEFGLTPHADINYDPDWLMEEFGDTVLGATLWSQKPSGQYDVILRDFTKGDEPRAEEISSADEKTKWGAKGSGNISHVPVHELGHVLYSTLFPVENTSAKSEDPFKSHTENLAKLVNASLKDVGADDGAVSVDSEGGVRYNEAATNKITEVSGYANAGGLDEVIAESLSDYYYNRDNAADLSKAIVRRLKSSGRTYGLRQMGSVDLSPTQGADDFVRNFRRYRVIQ